MGKEIRFLKDAGLIPRKKQMKEMYSVGYISALIFSLMIIYGII